MKTGEIIIDHPNDKICKEKYKELIKKKESNNNIKTYNNPLNQTIKQNIVKEPINPTISQLKGNSLHSSLITNNVTPNSRPKAMTMAEMELNEISVLFENIF